MIVVVAGAVLFAGIARPQTAPQRDRCVAVTIDDLPANMFRGDLSDWQEMTAMLLAGLVRHEVPAIGFVNEGKLYIDGAPDPDPAYVALLQAWLDAGLELGNHTFSHPDLLWRNTSRTYCAARS
jgi:peptidoglycan/xylan/chitin deacetylase (PgdA/CDA1 family)